MSVSAQQYAWQAHKILHRDISIGNILIWYNKDQRPQGKLADWDLAKFYADKVEDKKDTVGAWPWRSVSSHMPVTPTRTEYKLSRRVHGSLSPRS